MPETDWRKVVAHLRELASHPTSEQLQIARTLGFPIQEDTPQPVATALLRRHLRDPLALREPHEATEGTLEYLEDLAAQTNSTMPVDVEDKEEADGWIKVFYARRAATCLETLKPSPGDIVHASFKFGAHLAEVLSISIDGNLNFYGGLGHRARPHLVTMVERVSRTADYKNAQYKARQYAAARAKSPQVIGPGRLADLEQWRVEGVPTTADRLALLDALEVAETEQPMQVVLEKHPEILAYLVTGHGGAYVRPQVKLQKYVTDFLIAGYTSAGIRWTLVELERPNAELTIGDGQPSAILRRAIQQIEDWREWLTANHDHARKSISDDGLGLAGIRGDARGLIVIGRGILSSLEDKMRDRIERQSRIAVRTYDWLVRQSGEERGLPFGALDRELPEETETGGW